MTLSSAPHLDTGAGKLDDVPDVAALRADDGADGRVGNVDERRLLKHQTSTASENKCRPILVQGLQRDIENNFHMEFINGSVAEWISAWLWN